MTLNAGSPVSFEAQKSNSRFIILSMITGYCHTSALKSSNEYQLILEKFLFLWKEARTQNEGKDE